ncbi:MULTISPECIES: alpha/beta fold hydrolase [Pseudomonas]|uniref:alpha/beta fold hydrolase n=1 Tax=Pseudomonas TaxID=286 RepID=UPI00349EAD5B
MAIDDKGPPALAGPQVLSVLHPDEKRTPSRLGLFETTEGAKKGSRQRPDAESVPAQLQAIKAWGNQAPQDLGRLRIPTLVANGDSDIMVPSENSVALAHRIADAQLIIYEDAGHGAIFQHHTDFVTKALAFLGG